MFSKVIGGREQNFALDKFLMKARDFSLCTDQWLSKRAEIGIGLLQLSAQQNAELESLHKYATEVLQFAPNVTTVLSELSNKVSPAVTGVQSAINNLVRSLGAAAQQQIIGEIETYRNQFNRLVGLRYGQDGVLVSYTNMRNNYLEFRKGVLEYV